MLMTWWRKVLGSRRDAVLVISTAAPASASKIKRDSEMRNEQWQLLSSLGFDMNDDGQCWLQEARVMKRHDDAIADLTRRVEALEGK